MKAHDKLVEACKKAADALHADTTVDKYTTRASLRDVADHVEILIEAVSTDLEGER